MGRCRFCSEKLSLPYIQCAECPQTVNICLVCFATGSQNATHSRGHGYRLIHGSIPVISQSWTAIEDIKMLNAIQKYGLNWELVATMLPKKNELECQNHFYKYFVDEPLQKALMIQPNTKYDTRKVAETSSDGLTQALARLPSTAVDHKRGDWDCRFKNSAEEDFMFGEGGDGIVRKLQVGVMESYRKTLRKRTLLQNIYYEHGDILLKTKPPPDPKDTPPQIIETSAPGSYPLETMLKFSRFLTKDRFNDIQAKYNRIEELKKSITELQAVRRSGISSKFGVDVYNKRKFEREMKPGQKHTHTKRVRDVFYNNNLSLNTRRNNVKLWLSAATKTL